MKKNINILSLLLEKKDPLKTRIVKRKSIIYIFLILLYCFQIILGYFLIKSSYFIAQNHANAFYLFSYFVTLIAISYTIYCYILTYNILKKFFSYHIKFIQMGLICFYIISLISYTFVSGSYSPFFLFGIKIAQN